MARTLTAGALAAKEARYKKFDLLLESTALNLHYSIDTTTAGGHAWEQRFRLEGLGDISNIVEPGGGLARPSQLRLLVVDDGIGQSISALNNVGAVHGADMTLSLLFDGENYADKIPLFTGILEEFRRVRLTAELIIIDESFQGDKDLPQQIVNSDDHPNADVSALGQPLPIIYGFSVHFGPAPLLLIDTTANNGLYKVAGHPLKTFDGLGQNEWGPYNSDARVVVGTTFVNSATRDAAAATIRIDSTISGLYFGDIAGTQFVQREQDVVNSSNPISPPGGDVAVIHTDTFLQNGDGYGFLGLSASFPNNLGRDVVRILIEHSGGLLAATTVHARITVRLITDAGGVQREGVLILTNLRWYSGNQSTDFDVPGLTVSPGERVELFIEVFNDGGLGTINDTWEVGTVNILHGHYTSGINPPLFTQVDITGRPDDGLGTYTGIPDHFIRERPCDVIYNILTEELGLMFDTATLPGARLLYPDTPISIWGMDGAIGNGWFIERTKGRDLVDLLARHAKAIVMRGEAGFKVIPFDEAATSEYAFDLDTMLWTAGTDPRSDVQTRQSTFTLNQALTIPIYNDFELHYQYNAARGDFSRVMFVNDLATSLTSGSDPAIYIALCADSVARYGKQPPFIMQAPFTGQFEVAETVLKYYVDYFVEKRTVAEFETGTQGLHLELGDFITIDHPDLALSLRGTVLFQIHQLHYRFIPVQNPDGKTVLTFRIRVVASAPMDMGAFEETAFGEGAFETF